MKICSKCKETKTAEEFSPYKKAKDGLYSYCKPCSSKKVLANRNKPENLIKHQARMKSFNLRTKYGLTVEQYEEMYAAQDGKCAICEQTPDLLYVDHNHQTKLVRKLLCMPCNVTLGNMKDNPTLLRRAADYLEEF